MYDPIAGDTVANVLYRHQIRVTVNGVPARCNTNCSFGWYEDDTPVVSAISETEGENSSLN